MAIGGAIALVGVRNPERPPERDPARGPGSAATAGECGALPRRPEAGRAEPASSPGRWPRH